MPALPDYKVEACVTNVAEAVHAMRHGAHRIELCIRLETEGMTPSLALVEEVVSAVNIPVRVMVRATDKRYESDPLIFDIMSQEISELKGSGIEGFVFGLMQDGCIDRLAMDRLLERSHPLPVTFHKAIDASDQLISDMEYLAAKTQIDGILTSGGAVSAAEGLENILLMKAIAPDKIIGAGKIKAQDVEALHQKLGLRWYHGRAIV